MMRPVWKGAISFGLVNIPIRLYVATRQETTGFRMLHERCHTPVQYRKWCSHCEQELEMAEIKRGLEVNPGEYVVIEDEELEELPLPTARTVQILDFVQLSDVDPIYYDRSYYMEPAEGAERPYELLRAAMADSGRTAIAKVLLRTKEAVASVRVFGKNMLVMHTMVYSSDVREPVAIAGSVGTAEVDPRELAMAKSLIDNLTCDFEPQRYRSEYREALDELIASKVSGRQVVAPGPERPRVIDLMEALKESVQQSEQRRVETGP